MQTDSPCLGLLWKCAQCLLKAFRYIVFSGLIELNISEKKEKKYCKQHYKHYCIWSWTDDTGTGTNGIGTYVDGTGFGTDNISTSMRVRTPSWSNLWGILGSLNELSRCNANASGNIFDGEGCLSLPQKLEPCQVSGLLTCELWVGKPDWTLEPAWPEAFWLLPLLCVHLTSLHC